MNYRALRVANVIRDELGILIMRELEFSGLVTITRVEIDGKMEKAHVGISVIPSAEAEASLKTLKAAQGLLQHKLLRKLNFKPMPRIEFEIDHGTEKAAEVEKILLEDESPKSQEPRKRRGVR